MKIYIVYFESGQYEERTKEIASVFGTKRKADNFARNKNLEIPTINKGAPNWPEYNVEGPFDLK